MSAADLERLFWEELDGPPSAARLERIEALSRERPEMRRELEELRSLAGDLDAVEEAAAPPELRIEVRRLVASRPAPCLRGGLGLYDLLLRDTSLVFVLS